jgi:hypothetical protein
MNFFWFFTQHLAGQAAARDDVGWIRDGAIAGLRTGLQIHERLDDQFHEQKSENSGRQHEHGDYVK